MLQRTVFFRVAGPTIFVSLLLLASCTAVAAYLYTQQAATAEAYGENVGSREAANELEITLRNLLLVIQPTRQEPHHVPEQVQALHDEVDGLIAKARGLADKAEEERLVTELASSFTRYKQLWQAGVQVELAERGPGLAKAIDTLGSDTLQRVAELREYNSQQTKESAEEHRRTVEWMIYGLTAVGGIGSLAGICLGYGVSRALRRSIYQLSVRVRDAAGKLGQDLPTVTISEDGDLHQLHQQMQDVVREVEQVVERLQQREREVLRAEQMAAVGQVAAGVAHELRNPLTSVKMLVQKSRKQAGGPAMPSDNLQIIEQEIRRMERCLQTFLDFARPPKPDRRPTDLAALVERTFSLIEGRARNQHVALQLTANVRPVTLQGDWEQLQQLLLNLALNSLDAMPHGGTIDVRLDQHDSQIELRVQDTGPGISERVLPRLFEPFVSGKETGLGLGLVVSRRIAEDHGGSLSAYNRTEGGACFVLRLKAAPELAKV